ncbi:hypothetical protein ACN38_g10365, partial [Penicillium nordicum]
MIYGYCYILSTILLLYLTLCTKTYRGPGSKPFWEGFMPECLNLERQK